MKQKRHLRVIGEQTMEEYRRSDIEMDMRLSKTPIVCKKGCAACCKQLVSMTTQELAAIMTAYPDVVAASMKKAVKQLDRLAVMSEAVFGVNTVFELKSREDVDAFDKKINELGALWWAEQEPCIFLSEANTCKVYDARPIACRSYYVRSDPQRCFDKETTDVAVYQFPEMQKLRNRLLATSDGGVTLSALPTLIVSAKNLI